MAEFVRGDRVRLIQKPGFYRFIGNGREWHVFADPCYVPGATGTILSAPNNENISVQMDDPMPGSPTDDGAWSFGVECFVFEEEMPDFTDPDEVAAWLTS